jgi:hypothetical protein
VVSLICDPLSTPPCAGSSTITVRLIGMGAGPGGELGVACRAGAVAVFAGAAAGFPGAVTGRFGAVAGFDVPWAGGPEAACGACARPINVITTSRPTVAECRRRFKRSLGLWRITCSVHLVRRVDCIGRAAMLRISSLSVSILRGFAS